MIPEGTKEAAEVMLAYANGKKIEYRWRGSSNNWMEMDSYPVWNWEGYQYRIKPQQTSNGKELTEQESNFMNSFIWYKPKYGGFNPLTGLNAIQVSKLYEADSPHFLGENLFLNPFTNQWVEWTEEFRDKLKKHYAVPAKPKEKNCVPATEKELETINRKTVWIKHKKNLKCMGHVLANDKIIDENWLVFNPDTKCWEDWGEK